MQSDTIIGIVGAVVLVAVMVGVFAYEYNNAPEPMDGDGGEMTEAEKMAAFEAAYPGLNATDDIDNDLAPNYNDTDFDGDGRDNDVDNETMVHKTFNGNVAARMNPTTNPANSATQFVIGQGHKGGTVTVEWTFTALPAGSPPDELVVSITGPGDVTCDNTQNGVATCDLGAATPGKYTIEVRHANQLAQEHSFTGEYHVMY